MKKCPYCAEEVQEDAKVCGRCQSDLTVAPPPGQPVLRVTSKMAVASLALVTLIVIILVSFILLMILMPSGTFNDTTVYSTLYDLIFFSLSATILAIIFGHRSRRDIRRSAGRLKGAGIALAGLILGYAGAAIIMAI